jgi:outer membrane protein OmpA-like peptidoglycan-associated protein
MGFRLPKTAALAIAGCAALTATSASAQDVQSFKPASGTWNYFSVDGNAIAEPGALVPALYFNYGRNPLVRRNENDVIIEEIVRDLTTFDVMLTAGVTDWVEVGLDLPISYSVGAPGVQFDDGGGLGDLRVLPKFTVLDYRDFGGFGMSIGLPMSFPTGTGANSARKFIANPRGVLEYRAKKWSIAANAGYRIKPGANDLDTNQIVTIGNGFTYGLGLGVNLGTPTVRGIVEGYGTVFEGIAEREGGPRPLEVLGGLRIVTGDTGLALTLAGGAGVINDFGAAELRVLGGIAWNFGDSNDVRGATLVQAPIDNTDTDGDGVRDLVDACPEEPEDRDTFQDADGCPDKDNDIDGIADVDDKCPLRPEDIDNWEDADGCPDPDNDGDGLVDAQDRCPVDAETKNGHRDEDGCPDAGLVRVEGDRIVILRKVYFDTDKDTIKPMSYGILNQVAEVLSYNKGIERLRIEGHTDARASTDYNQNLSERRAAAVLQYLLGQGIEESRLESQGFGESRPATADESIGGHARNRRVEFMILSRSDTNGPKVIIERSKTVTRVDEPTAKAEPAKAEAEDAADPYAAPAAAGLASKAQALKAEAPAVAPRTKSKRRHRARMMKAVAFSGREDGLTFTFRADGPLSTDRVETFLDSQRKVLVMRVHGLKVKRAWQSWSDRQVVRSLLFPKTVDTAVLRVRFTGPFDRRWKENLKISASGDSVSVSVGRPPKVLVMEPQPVQPGRRAAR